VTEAVLRDMRWWDLDAVLALEHDLFPEDAWSRGMFWSELADTRHPGGTRTYLVAETPDGRIVGYAGLAAVSGTGDVQTIATARDHWGTGLGAALLTALLRAATAAECHEVLLEVRVDNARAQRLYQRFGFEPIGVRRGYYQPGNVDALVMRLGDPAAATPADVPVADVPVTDSAPAALRESAQRKSAPEHAPEDDVQEDVQETGTHG
jgi:ribosomal-protein-alanine N-acetyltransferase